MEGPKMPRREELRAGVKAERERMEEARKEAADPVALMAKIAQLKAQASMRESRVRTAEVPVQAHEERPFEITPKMRADAAAIAARDRGLPPDSR